MIRVKLRHLTEYEFSKPVSLFPHIVRLRPAPHTRTHIESYSCDIEPAKKFINWQQDPFSNWQARLVFPEKTARLKVEVNLVAHIQVYNPFDFFIEDYAAKFPFSYEEKLKTELAPYLAPSEDSSELLQFTNRFKPEAKNMVDYLVAANAYVKSHVGYIIRLEPGVQKAHETLNLAKGSCRDSAYLLVQMLRHLGLAARFVSGYLIQLKADETSTSSLDEHQGPTADFTDLHAWAEVFIPGAGWIGLDATSGLFAAEGHIPLAATPEPESAAAINGFTEPCESKLTFAMEITRLSETPRVSKPYTEETWHEILKLGASLDKALKKSDMRLTIGGEPTFVSATDRESRQWNFDALGDDKLALSEKLIERLHKIYAAGGVVLRSQGKWYPGEPLPRWSLDSFWLKDGKPLWRDLKRLGFSSEQKNDSALRDARTVLEKILIKLNLDAKNILEAVDIPNSPKGFIAALSYESQKKKWQSEKPKILGEVVTLLSGDSPIGLRLPLGEIKSTIKTFICAELRDGRLHIFLPPIDALDGYIELLQTIENATTESIVLEGYPPPADPRLGVFRITPDPGVIEVNMHPSATVLELVKKTQTIYDEAEKLGLTTDRYMLDGRPQATGGGNHITVGALTRDDSPFLRRGDLLASVVSYWQNHPSLSYLFSGMFIGPTSQAPRIDEARDGNLYEAEIALKELRRVGGALPWQIDRIMRNVLVDMTGNTHRAEISIDKLFAPGSATGRLGLVELRAFEMPPHWRMSVVQQLMIVALLLKFWREPYKAPLKPWGNELKDKWLLPHFIEEDFGSVLADLRTCGYKFEKYFFAPFFEFRFPLYGAHKYEGVTVELRAALEPWNVLGEEVLGGGVSRSVDSAVERLQIKLMHFDEARYSVACNGFEIPLSRASGKNDSYVAGVLYKAWAPPFTLHPTIPVHAPLAFTIYDKTTQKYVAGITYHVAHPGGRSYDTYPVNSYEAESRRLSRFEAQAKYPKHPPKVFTNPMNSHTLDLRWT